VIDLVNWVINTKRVKAFIGHLKSSYFSKVEVFEHHSTTYKCKLSLDNHSIGYVYSLMEELKHEYWICDYEAT